MITLKTIKALSEHLYGARMLWAKMFEKEDERWHRQEKQKKWIC